MTADATTKAESLQAALAALAARGADRFNPVRFGFIKAMANRALEQRESVANLVADKALAALRKYQSELLSEQAGAGVLIKQVASLRPEAAEQAQAMFEAHDFRGIRRLAAPTQRSASSEALTDLLQRINGGDRPGIDPTESAQQNPGELSAIRHFRETLQRQHADEVVSRAVTEVPAESGPLNPQKLAIHSLKSMRELSPAYLGRFVSYIDTLFWLEHTAERNKS